MRLLQSSKLLELPLKMAKVRLAMVVLHRPDHRLLVLPHEAHVPVRPVRRAGHEELRRPPGTACLSRPLNPWDATSIIHNGFSFLKIQHVN